MAGRFVYPLLAALAFATAGCANSRDPHPTMGRFIYTQGSRYAAVDFSDKDGVERAEVRDENGNVIKSWDSDFFSGCKGLVDSIEVPSGRSLNLQVTDMLGNVATYRPGPPGGANRQADAYRSIAAHTGRGK